MNTAIRDDAPATTAPAERAAAEIDLAFESAPRARDSRRTATRALDVTPRRVADRRPRDGRPGGAVELYRRGPVRTPVSRGPRGGHPMEDRVEQAQLGFAVLAAAALLSALVVTALIGLAHWRAGAVHDQTPGSVPGVVEQGAVPGGELPR